MPNGTSKGMNLALVILTIFGVAGATWLWGGGAKSRDISNNTDKISDTNADVAENKAEIKRVDIKVQAIEVTQARLLVGVEMNTKLLERIEKKLDKANGHGR